MDSTNINAVDRPQVLELADLLGASAATPAFKEAVERLSKQQAPGPAIAMAGGVPPVKALRAIMKLLETSPDLAVDRVRIDARSGCSDFVGSISVNDGAVVVDFKWDCAWRAEEQGWTDYFGAPDQIRAAREFGYQCFEEWRVR
jgi:hypothetical protein